MTFPPVVFAAAPVPAAAVGAAVGAAGGAAGGSVVTTGAFVVLVLVPLFAAPGAGVGSVAKAAPGALTTPASVTRTFASIVLPRAGRRRRP
ncbi:hypothetical protein GCM10009557_03890 [Virgisporangium ochraceum]|uniref:Uncharacterized protein n=1 Tax=Virgisporangium ochraceum TaxID=65505 RepID=A0A8J3ZWJ1_9ACTN|nr:hypothetical protein [Virgisporangium ochraceum]GIJ71674.1 hypothetical protein Voc01_065910 [Virgisporangium ochraceum]